MNVRYRALLRPVCWLRGHSSSFQIIGTMAGDKQMDLVMHCDRCWKATSAARYPITNGAIRWKGVTTGVGGMPALISDESWQAAALKSARGEDDD